MDWHQCLLCGGLFHPKNGHFCYWKESSEEDDAASFTDESEETVNNLERSLNIPSDNVSNSCVNRDETDLSCWPVHDQKNTFPHPDQTCRSPIPAQFSRVFEASTPCSLDDSRQTVFDSPIQKPANPSMAQVEKLQLVNSMSKDNQSNDSEHSFSTAADCSTESSEEHCSVVAPVPGPLEVETQSPRTQEAERFLCNVCGRGFVKKNNLKQHYRIHSEEKHFVCEKCGKKFKRKGDLVKHSRTHTGEKPFQCPKCSKKFSDPSNFQRHLKSHTSEKPFECAECGKRFSHQHHFKVHLRTHSFEKPFQCTECGRRFLHKHHLKYHLTTHTGEKNFECTECSKRFSQKQNLKVHLRTHTSEKPFDCTECNKRFSQKQHLKAHLKNHTVEKPFNCPECGKRFAQKQILKRHLNTHTRKSDEPSKCEICEKVYGSQAACNHQQHEGNDGKE